MPQKSDHDIKEQYPYVLVGTLEAMRIQDILNKKLRQRFIIR